MALLFTGRDCENQAQQTNALDLCRSVVRTSSSWSPKAIYMGARALAEVEGEHQMVNG